MKNKWLSFPKGDERTVRFVAKDLEVIKIWMPFKAMVLD
jgi:hypothetical protein